MKVIAQGQYFLTLPVFWLIGQGSPRCYQAVQASFLGIYTVNLAEGSKSRFLAPFVYSLWNVCSAESLGASWYKQRDLKWLPSYS